MTMVICNLEATKAATKVKFISPKIVTNSGLLDKNSFSSSIIILAVCSACVPHTTLRSISGLLIFSSLKKFRPYYHHSVDQLLINLTEYFKLCFNKLNNGKAFIKLGLAPTIKDIFFTITIY